MKVSLSVLGKKVKIVEASTMVSEAGVISVNMCLYIELDMDVYINIVRFKFMNKWVNNRNKYKCVYLI